MPCYATATTTRYYYDGQNVIAEYSVGGNGAESSPAARQYVNGTQYIDEGVAMVEPSTYMRRGCEAA